MKEVVNSSASDSLSPGQGCEQSLSHAAANSSATPLAPPAIGARSLSPEPRLDHQQPATHRYSITLLITISTLATPRNHGQVIRCPPHRRGVSPCAGPGPGWRTDVCLQADTASACPPTTAFCSRLELPLSSPAARVICSSTSS